MDSREPPPPPPYHNHHQIMMMMGPPPPNSYTPTTNNQQQQFPFHSKPDSQLDGSLSPSSSGFIRDAGFGIEPVKKKRGRPRKYSGADNFGLVLSPSSATPNSGTVGHAADSGGTPPRPGSDSKKGRGRPPSSGKKQLDALGIICVV